MGVAELVESDDRDAGSSSDPLECRRDRMGVDGVAIAVGEHPPIELHARRSRFGALQRSPRLEDRERRGIEVDRAARVAGLAPRLLHLVADGDEAAIEVAVIRARHGNATVGAEFWQVAAAAFLVMALSGLIGVSVGAMVRNQIIAVTLTLVWLTAGEHLLIEALPQVARWTPGGATNGLLQLGAVATTSGTLLNAPIGGLLLVGYTSAAVSLALVIATRRDVR